MGGNEFRQDEVTGGGLRAVGFRRREGTLDFARRFRFAYSLEHYNKLAGKRRTLEGQLVTLALAGGL